MSGYNPIMDIPEPGSPEQKIALLERRVERLERRVKKMRQKEKRRALQK